MTEEKISIEQEQCLVCPVCGMGRSEIGEPVIGINYMGVTLAYAKCSACTGYWLLNRMTEEFQKTYYRDYYRKITTPTVEHQALSLLAEEKRVTHQLRFINDILSEVDNVLDFGCSTGEMLKRLRDEYEITGVGVDIGVNSQSELAYVHGIQVYGSLDELKGANYDLIVLSHVLEHQNYPLKFLLALKEHLNDGGYMLIDVPNVHADRAAMLIHHPIAFSFTSMFRLLDTAGLEIEEFEKYDWEDSPIERSMMFLVKKE